MSNGGESDMMQQMVLTPSQKTLKESMLKATQMQFQITTGAPKNGNGISDDDDQSSVKTD